MVKSNAQSFGSNFLITVHQQENHSWQGVVEWLDTGKKIHFRSELELLSLMQQAVQSTQKVEDNLRSWDDARKISIV